MADTFLNTEELRNLPDNDLALELNNARQNLSALKISVATTKEKATHKIGQLRKYIARVATIMNERKREDVKKTKDEKKEGDNNKEEKVDENKKA